MELIHEGEILMDGDLIKGLYHLNLLKKTQQWY